MRLHELAAAPGSRKPRKRLGRGISQGQGKTCGKGTKGQFARTAHLPVGFEGGQMPLAQRLPKLRGFHNRFRKQYAAVNLGKLNRFEAGSTVDVEALAAAGLIGSGDHGVKVLNSGVLKVKLTLRVHRISAAARSAVEAAGGVVELIETREEPGARAADPAGGGTETAG